MKLNAIYIATDYNMSKNIISSHINLPAYYSHTLAKHSGKHSPDSIENALVDIIALSRCVAIIGTYRSTFTIFAGALGNIKPYVVRNGICI